MKKLYIIGAGGLGREVYSWMILDDSISQEYSIEGFVDDDLNKLDEFEGYPPIVGTLENFDFNKETDYAVLSIADTKTKEKITKVLETKVNIISFISSESIIAPNAKIGNGVVILPRVVVSCEAILQDYVFLNLGTQVGHDVQVGRYSSIMANVVIGGNVIIGESCYLGSSSTIIPRVQISNSTTLGMSSSVIRSVKKEGLTYFGNPARKI